MLATRTRTQVTEAEYLRLALADPDAGWEWLNGDMWEKPTDMTMRHNMSITLIDHFLQRQLDIKHVHVRVNSTRTARPGVSYFIPDLAVIPVARMRELQPDALEVYSTPLPLVVEVWSSSTREYDIATKLPEYQRRGDEEIWFVDSASQTITAYVRQADGTYGERVFRPGDDLRPVALPNVVIQVVDVFS